MKVTTIGYTFLALITSVSAIANPSPDLAERELSRKPKSGCTGTACPGNGGKRDLEDLVKRPEGPSPGTDDHKRARSDDGLVKRPTGPSPGTDAHKLARDDDGLVKRPTGPSPGTDAHKLARDDDGLVKRPTGPSPGTDAHKLARSDDDLVKRSKSKGTPGIDNHRRARDVELDLEE